MLGNNTHEPFDINSWSRIFLKAFPEIKWKVEEHNIGNILCIDHQQVVQRNRNEPIIVYMNNCSGSDIYIGRKSITEQERDIILVIKEVKELLNRNK